VALCCVGAGELVDDVIGKDVYLPDGTRPSMYDCAEEHEALCDLAALDAASGLPDKATLLR